ncbi:MAG TPA: hypothetical protein VHZ55_09190 [Bryobacteraceae bacterium]|jgi:hypothetical protein|nr:hypothetical protein [Bryobacteraceae bacterium]
MQQRYKIRAHESGERDGVTTEGTIVLHLGGSAAVEADSIDAVEAMVRKQVAAGKMAKGSVYQIVASGGTGERPRTLAVDLFGNFRECFLNPAGGFYSDFRRIHYPAPAPVIAKTAPEMEPLLI